jgi:putative tricarboxylic transport membrane protein
MNHKLKTMLTWFAIIGLAGFWLYLAKDMAGTIANASLSGLIQVFAWPAFGYMLIGIAIGFAVGLLPGLGGPVTMALMLGFVFQLKMNAVEAFAFLLGMVSVTATTGDITSILFGIPGEGSTASTLVEGHPMAKKGEAGRALGAALLSSLMGAVLGALSIAVAIPFITPLVLSIGTPEFFMLAVSGVAFVGALSGGSVLKGLAAGGLGFLFSLVGLDPQTGTERYTFGLLYLWGAGETGGAGIGLVPATVGLFAIPEIIDLAVKGGSIAQTDVGKIGGVFQGVKDCFRHWWLVVRCSLIGTYIGIIPGMGGPVSQWVSYAYAMRTSNKQDRIGTGEVEGVLGPGAANNSTLGGALIPTIAFGVPGNVVSAILLGAFLILGLVPGPSMLTKDLHVIFAMIWVLIVSNIITVAISFLFLRQIAQLTRIRGSLLIPVLLLFIFLGSYTHSNNFGDIVVMLLFGALGCFMVAFGWSRPALLLGLVLGRLTDNYLWLSYARYEFEFLARPGVMAIIALVIITVLYPAMKKRWRKQ